MNIERRSYPTPDDTEGSRINYNEGFEEAEAQQERTQQTSFQRIADEKSIADSVIESKTYTVQDIFNVLERRTVDTSETVDEEVIENPEEILETIKSNLSQIEQPTLEDISKALVTSGLEIREVEPWLLKNKNEVDSLFEKKESLETRGHELSKLVAEEQDKNFILKLFRFKKRKEAETALEKVTDKIQKTGTVLEKSQSRVAQVESGLFEVVEQRQKLALETSEELFHSVDENRLELKEKLTAPAVIQELNEGLFAEQLVPSLEALLEEGNITKEDVDEYIEILKVKLSEGGQTAWHDTAEDQEAFQIRRKRLDELDAKSGYKLEDIGRRIGSGGRESADSYYARIFDLLLREATKEQIEQTRDFLNASITPEYQKEINDISEEIIYPYSDYKIPQEERKDILDLNKIPIEDIDNLKGLERWQVVKRFTESSGVISKEVFEKTENVLLRRLFEERLYPGGQESHEGTEATQKMLQLGNPSALPLMLKQVEAFGGGHTNNQVVFAMEKLLQESDPIELEQVMETLPKNKRILLETLANENSYLNQFGRINQRYYTCQLLQNSNRSIAREKLTEILDKHGVHDKDELKSYYYGEKEYSPEKIELLLQARDDVERTIIESKEDFWTQTSEKLLASLVNPRNGESVAFPKRVAQEGLGVSEKEKLEVLDNIFEAKTFKGSGYEREAFLDGLILLNSKENGKVVLETLLGAYRGTRNDPARMRRVFQILSTLDGFGEYEFVMPNQEKVHGTNQEIVALQNQYSQTKDKTERKEIKNRVETLQRDLQNQTGLKGIEDTMTQKVVEVACRKLELPEEYRDKVQNNLDELLKNGLFEIVPMLAGTYEGKKEPEVKKLLTTITTHIIDGDFKSWKYSNEQTEAQLALLSEEQKEFWQSTVEPVRIDIELSSGEKDKRGDELRATQEIIRNAKDHILNSQPNFDFSKEREYVLDQKISELTQRIKSSSTEKEKKQLGLEKRTVQAEAMLIKGILSIESATTQTFSQEKILAQARELRERITELDIPLAGLDIEQIGKIFTVGDIQSVQAYESDDALTLLKVGVEPQETCQSWRNGGFNECLLAYVADSNKKVINVADNEGKIVARSIFKLTNQRDVNDVESKTQRKTLLVEKPYSLLPSTEVHRAFARVLLTKAQGIDASITMGKGFSEDILNVFADEARAFGYKISEGGLDVYIPKSLNKYEYSDTLGGKISWFDKYQKLDAVTFEKANVQ